MDFQPAIQAIRAGQTAPVYTIFGSEQYLRDQLLEALRQATESDGESDRLTLDLNEQALMDAIDEANMFSFFADQRLILAWNANFATSQGSKLEKHEEKALEEYLKNPNKASVLVFVIPGDQLDKRRKGSKLLQKHSTFVDITPMDEGQVQRYVQTYIANSNLDMTREAVGELLRRVDGQLSQAMHELEKLESYHSLGRRITLDVVEDLVPRTLESDVFELSNAVVTKQIDRAIQIYQDLRLMKHEPIALHALIVSQFRIMIQTKLLAQEGMMEGQISSHLGVHPYRVKLAMQSVRQMPFEELVDFYNQLVEADYGMKTGVGDQESHFYLLLTRLMEMK